MYSIMSTVYKYPMHSLYNDTSLKVNGIIVHSSHTAPRTPVTCEDRKCEAFTQLSISLRASHVICYILSFGLTLSFFEEGPCLILEQ